MSCHDNILQVLDLRGNGTVLTTVGGDGYHVGCDWSRYKDITLNLVQTFSISQGESEPQCGLCGGRGRGGGRARVECQHWPVRGGTEGPHQHRVSCVLAPRGRQCGQCGQGQDMHCLDLKLL